MVEQRGLATKLTGELEQSEIEHRRLVKALHAETTANALHGDCVSCIAHRRRRKIANRRQYRCRRCSTR